eukprot:1333418-Alexandrium_andersonii.AAC.1
MNTSHDGTCGLLCCSVPSAARAPSLASSAKGTEVLDDTYTECRSNRVANRADRAERIEPIEP